MPNIYNTNQMTKTRSPLLNPIPLATLLAVLTLLSSTSCVEYKQLRNFTEGGDIESSLDSLHRFAALRIQPDDLLSVRIKALDPLASMPYNIDDQNQAATIAVGGGRPLIGYLVDSEGNIDLVGLGTLHVGGMTVQALKDTLAQKLRPYLDNPVINIRLLNFRVSILGEVKAPGTFIFSNERVSILDAIGQCSDITPYGDRTRILVIREQNGRREKGYLNLQSRDIFTSPFFYLRQNDLIYVEPLPEITASLRDQSQRVLPWLSIITSFTTLVLALIATQK
jgi:polysaccharide export outer membrane protein